MNLTTNRACLVCLAYLFLLRLHSQSLKTIEIDTISDQPKAALPFDEPFLLKAYAEKDEKLLYFTIRELKRNGEYKSAGYWEYHAMIKDQYNYLRATDSKPNAKKWRIDFKTDYPRSEFSFSSLNEDFKTYQKKSFQEIYMKVPPIDPASLYEFSFLTSDNKVLNDLVDIVILISQGNVADAETTFTNDIVPLMDSPELVGYLNFDSLKSYASSGNASMTNQLTKISTNLTSLGVAPTTISLDNSINEVLEPVYKYDYPYTDGNKEINISIRESYSSTFDLVRSLYKLSDAEAKQMLNGFFKIGDISPYNLVSSTNFSGRKSNLENSITSFNQMIKLTDFLILQDLTPTNGSYHDLREDFINYRDQLASKKQNIVNITSARTQIAQDIQQKHGLYNSKFIHTTTDIQTFKSRYAFRIVPDFGFAFMWNGGNLINDTGLVPYLGFHINFRPINKDIPFKSIRFKSLSHYLSFTSGITLNSVKIENQRTDFFSNYSLLTGFGFRINNAFRLVGGTIWFKKIDSDPLIDTTKLSFSPYAAVSVDLELQELFGGVKNVFTK